MKRALLLLCSLLGVLAALAWTSDRWLFWLLDPGPFDPARSPPAPDYAQPSAWAALPELEDGADVALTGSPAVDPALAPADVFYVHPTTWVGPAWNGPVDDPVVIEGTERGGVLIQASAFNACCAVYAPRYRQANGRAYVHPDAFGQRARDLAYGDLSRAFDRFLERTGERPFIVAGHSQGSVLAARLVRERIAGGPLEARLIAAYLPGAPLREDTVGLPVCRARSEQTGCWMAWNARGPGYRPNGLEFDADDPDTLTGRVCVHPAGGGEAAALFFDDPAPRVLEGFSSGRCEGGVLVLDALGPLERDLPSRALLWMMGPENYHPIEYQLFYPALRADASRRTQAWRAAPP